MKLLMHLRPFSSWKRRFLYLQNPEFDLDPKHIYRPLEEDEKHLRTLNLLPGGLAPEDLFDARGQLFCRKGTEVSNRGIEILGRMGYVVREPMDPVSVEIHHRIAHIDDLFRDFTDEELRDGSHDAIKETIGKLHESGRIEELTSHHHALIETVVQEWTPEEARRFFALTHKSNDTVVHSVDVMFKAYRLGVRQGLPEAELIELMSAALLHDIGKLLIDEKILHKPGALNKEERKEMEKHAVYTQEILTNCGRVKSHAGKAGGLHHRKHSAKDPGYGPHTHDHLVSEETHEGYTAQEIEKAERHSDIIAVADVHSALMEERVYRRDRPMGAGFTLAETLSIMNDMQRKRHFHHKAFDHFHEMMFEKHDDHALVRGEIMPLTFVLQPENMESMIEAEIADLGLKGEAVFAHKRRRRDEIPVERLKAAGYDETKAKNLAVVVVKPGDCKMKATVHVIEKMGPDDPVSKRLGTMKGNFKMLEQGDRILDVDLTHHLIHPHKSPEPSPLTPAESKKPSNLVFLDDFKAQQPDILAEKELMPAIAARMKELVTEHKVPYLREKNLAYVLKVIQRQPEHKRRALHTLLDQYEGVAVDLLFVTGRCISMALALKMNQSMVVQLVDSALFHNCGRALSDGDDERVPEESMRIITDDGSGPDVSALVAGFCYEREGNGHGVTGEPWIMEQIQQDYTPEQMQQAIFLSRIVGIAAHEQKLKTERRFPLEAFISMLNNAREGSFEPALFDAWYKIRMKEKPLSRNTRIPYYMLDTDTKAQIEGGFEKLFSEGRDQRNVALVIEEASDPMKARVKVLAPSPTSPGKYCYADGGKTHTVDLSQHLAFSIREIEDAQADMEAEVEEEAEMMAVRTMEYEPQHGHANDSQRSQISSQQTISSAQTVSSQQTQPAPRTQRANTTTSSVTTSRQTPTQRRRRIREVTRPSRSMTEARNRAASEGDTTFASAPTQRPVTQTKRKEAA